MNTHWVEIHSAYSELRAGVVVLVSLSHNTPLFWGKESWSIRSTFKHFSGARYGAEYNTEAEAKEAAERLVNNLYITLGDKQ